MEERYQEREEAQQLADMQELQSQLPDVELPEDAETEEPLFPDQQAMTNELPAQEDSEISEPIQVVNFHYRRCSWAGDCKRKIPCKHHGYSVA